MVTNMKKQITILVLLASLLQLSACGTSTEPVTNPTDTVDTQPVETEAETDHYEALQELDYGGYEFKTLTYEEGSWYCYEDPVEETGDVLNDAAFQRNLKVEELLNITITGMTENGIESYEKTFKNQILAGDTSGAEMLIFWSPGDRSGFITENLVYDWQEIPHLRLSEAWYNQTANEAFTMAGKQYFAVSDYTFPIQQHWRLLFNKALVEDMGLTSPYDAVFEGTWTFDLLMSMVKDSYIDLNGDGKAGMEDQYGIGLNPHFSSAFVLNANEMHVYVTADGFQTNLYSDRIVSIMEKVVAFKQNQDILVSAGGNNHYNVFNEGRSLFSAYGSDPANLRDIEDFDFGYLPYPKFDDAQEDYVVWSAGGMMAVSSIVEDIDRTGAIIEALSVSSNQFVKDAFVEKYIEGKVLRDEESQKIYRMMRDRATYDLAYNIDPAKSIANMAYYNGVLNSADGSIASYYAKVGEKIETAYAELWAQITE